MPGVGLQFHAAPEEFLSDLLPLIAPPSSGLRVYHLGEADVMQGIEVPFRGGVADLAARPPAQLVVALSGTRPVSPSAQPVGEGGNALTVTLGLLQETGLRETLLGAAILSREALTSFRPAIRRLRASLLVGATATGPTGVSAPAPNHHYSRGALALANQGVPMLALAGSTTHRFDRQGPGLSEVSVVPS